MKCLSRGGMFWAGYILGSLVAIALMLRTLFYTELDLAKSLEQEVAWALGYYVLERECRPERFEGDDDDD